MKVMLRLDPDLDAGLRADLAEDLQQTLLEFGMEAAVPAAAGPADRAKSTDLVAWGSLLVSVASVASLRTVVDALSSWLHRQPQDIVIEVDGAKLAGVVSAEQRAQLIDAYTERLRRDGQTGAEPAGGVEQG